MLRRVPDQINILFRQFDRPKTKFPQKYKYLYLLNTQIVLFFCIHTDVNSSVFLLSNHTHFNMSLSKLITKSCKVKLTGIILTKTSVTIQHTHVLLQ